MDDEVVGAVQGVRGAVQGVRGAVPVGEFAVGENEEDEGEGDFYQEEAGVEDVRAVGFNKFLDG